MKQTSLSAKTEASEKIILERWDVINTLCNEANQKIRPKSRIEQLLYFLLIFAMEKNTFEDICGYFSLFWVILLVGFLGRFVCLLKMKKS